MKVQLNIRVDYPGSTTAQDNAEAKRVIAVLHDFPGLFTYHTERVQNQTEIDMGLEHQDVIWAEVSCPDISLRCAVHILADKLGRDCIAVYDPKTDIGALVGPRIEGYGHFDHDLFLTPLGAHA